MLRPGEFKITDRAMALWNLPRGSKVLEIGCGEGETLERLEKEYGFDMTGLDMSLEMVRLAKERGLLANIMLGDGEFIEEFPSRTFDGVVMECVLSLINLPDEALHETFCVLKDGGMLFISDLYLKNPEPGLLRAVDIEAKRMAKVPHGESSCDEKCAEDHKKRVVNFRYQGALLLQPMEEELRKMGFEILATEDFSPELDSYLAESILSGQMKLSDQTLPKGTGYLMMVARKQGKADANE